MNEMTCSEFNEKTETTNAKQRSSYSPPPASLPTLAGTPGGGGGYSTQSWASTVKLIEKALSVNLQTEGAVTFP